MEQKPSVKLQEGNWNETIIKNAFELECRAHAMDFWVLYRGCKGRDTTQHREKLTPYSLSYGTTLFGGVA